MLCCKVYFIEEQWYHRICGLQDLHNLQILVVPSFYLYIYILCSIIDMRIYDIHDNTEHTKIIKEHTKI